MIEFNCLYIPQGHKYVVAKKEVQMNILISLYFE